MLVLSRKIGQKILIGDDIVVEVVKVKGFGVMLGITAPDDVSIDREEVRARKNDGVPFIETEK
jgi:carbon storage regulator